MEASSLHEVVRAIESVATSNTNNQMWGEWASKWLDGTDRTAESAARLWAGVSITVPQRLALMAAISLMPLGEDASGLEPGDDWVMRWAHIMDPEQWAELVMDNKDEDE